MLHAIYSVQKQKATRVIVMSNDSDVIVMAIYYGNSLLKDVELWMNTAPGVYLPIHDIVNSLGPRMCRILPFIHSVSGRDPTSFPFNTGKKAWLLKAERLDLSALEALGEEPTDIHVTDEVIAQARELFIAVYSSVHDDFSGSDLSLLRMYKFLNSKSVLMKVLPATEDAFLLHVLRAALTTIIDKSAHISKPDIPALDQYGWELVPSKDGSSFIPKPIPSTLPPWPEQMPPKQKCGCTKGCKSNCSCRKIGVACYIGCRCQGDFDKCTWAGELAALQSESETSSSESGSECESENEAGV